MVLSLTRISSPGSIRKFPLISLLFLQAAVSLTRDFYPLATSGGVSVHCYTVQTPGSQTSRLPTFFLAPLSEQGRAGRARKEKRTWRTSFAGGRARTRDGRRGRSCRLGPVRHRKARSATATPSRSEGRRWRRGDEEESPAKIHPLEWFPLLGWIDGLELQ